MTPSERERRIKAAAEAGRQWFATHPDGASSDAEWRDVYGAALDAAHEAVPVVSLGYHDARMDEALGRERDRAERAEAAARDFAEALREISGRKPGHTKTQVEGMIARHALLSHPSFSGEEGSEG